MDEPDQVHGTSIAPGEGVYDEDGRLIAHISSVTENGFEAETVDQESREIEDIPGQEFGEGYLMWRCTECGEMGELDDGMPDSCPSCDAPGEAITQQVED